MKLIDNKIIDDLNLSLGLHFFPKKERMEILTRILELISKRAGLRIMEKFTDEETADFNNIPKDDFGKMEEFILAKNPNAKGVFEEEAGKVKEELLEAKM